MPTPPRPLVALLLAIALNVGALAVPPVAPPPTDASIVAPYAATATAAVAPGVSHDWGAMYTTSGQQNVHVVEVPVGDPNIGFEAALSNGRVGGLERVSSMAASDSAEGHRVVAAINGDVWSGYANDMELAPAGLDIQDGELVTSGTTSRVTFGVTSAGQPMIGQAMVTISMVTGSGVSLTVDRVNQLRRAGEIAMYTPRFGPRTSSAATGLDVVISGVPMPLPTNGTFSGVVSEVRQADGGWPIDPGTFVLTGPPTNFYLSALTPGEPVTFTLTITPGWETVTQAVGGREWIVKDGAEYIYPRPSTADQTHPRSAIGLTADGHAILMTVDGRQPNESLGVTLPELASLMLSRGAVNAINLDGGGSTTMVVREPGDVNASVVNVPSDGSERAVTNSIQVISHIPTGPLAQLTVQPGAQTLYQQQSVTYRAIGLDAGDNPVSLSNGLTWSVTPPIGTFDASGVFTATTPGSGSIVAQSAGVSGQAAITVLADTTAPVMGAPASTLTLSRSIGAGGVPTTISWPAATDTGSGVASYQLQRMVDGGAWADMPIASPTSRSVTLTLPRNRTFRFRVRASDKAGNAGAWMEEGSEQLIVYQESSAGLRIVKGLWPRATSPSYDGHAARTTRTTGGTAKFTFTGSEVAWVAAKSPTRGVARVYVDGADAGTVDLYRATSVARQMVFTRRWSSSGLHTLEIRALGTSGRPRVDVDAFVVYRRAANPPVTSGVPSPAPTPSPAPIASPSPAPPPTPSPTPPSPPASAGSSVVLLAAGDIASCSLTSDGATAKLVASQSGTVLTLGDNAYENGTAAEFSNCYAPTWGQFLSRTRPAPGNHDYGTAGAAGYFGYFGSRAGTAGKGWYAFNLGSWRIYSLNANCLAVGGCAAGSAQERWLKADLAAHPTSCVLAYWHQPRFSSGEHGDDAATSAFWTDLYAAGADVILNGHDHDYERFAPQDPAGFGDPSAGIREFVVGTGGASLRSFATVRANSEVRQAGTFGVLRLVLSATGYSWQFLRAAGNSFSDSGEASCH